MESRIIDREIFETPVIVFDLETTGFSPRAGDEIVEIGAIKTIAGKITGEFHSLVNPIRPISPGASAVNGITNDMVADAPLMENVLPGFLDFIGDSPLVAHNAAFDLSFLAWKIAEMGLPARSNIVFDTMQLSRRLHPEFYNHKLEGIVDQLGIEEPVGHRAVSDAVSTFAVFKKLIEPHSRNGSLTVGRALSLQGGAAPWPRFRPSEVDPGPETEIETAIRLAIQNDETIVIEYQSPSSPRPTTREIRPIHLARRPGRSYIIAYCMLRNENRVFRVDRIQFMESNKYGQ